MDEAVSAPEARPERRFPCRQCGAQLQYSPGSTALSCPYCGAETPIPRSEEEIEELDFRTYLAQAQQAQESLQDQRVRCGACGAETTLPPELSACQCPFCGADLMLTARESHLLKPKALLPFRITKSQALAGFHRWIRGLWFAPNALKRYARSEEKLVGLYLPYWTYDADAISFYRGARGDDYWVSQSFTTREGGRSVTRVRQVRRTRWTAVSGTVWNRFDDILVAASPSIPRKYADRLQPWDLPNLVPYAEEYLSGFRAESYRIDLAEGFEQAREIMDDGIRTGIRRDIGGDHQRIDSVKTRYQTITFKHILLPVWMSAYRFADRVYRIMINARTGEVQGERPFSVWKITAAVAAALILIAVIVGMVSLRS
jgi:DNA-directed RNA polymerase subunit RPC12/RpoP